MCSQEGPDPTQSDLDSQTTATLRSPGARRPRSGGISLSARGLTDQGRVRRNNEDNLAACDLSSGETFVGPFAFSRPVGPRGLIFMVADGMGGQACGELASRMCCELMPARLLESLVPIETPGPGEFGALLARALESVNQSILEAAQAEPACRGMGTTVTAAAVLGPSLVVAQVGDSRAYLLRGGHFVQLTRDQTFLNYLIEMGAIDREQAVGDPRRNILIQALGTAPKLNVALTAVDLSRGDQLLVMSDGLYSMVAPEEMLSIAVSSGDLGTRCRSLVDAANAQGGADNITLILAELEGSGLPPPDPGSVPKVESLSPSPEER